MTQSMNFIILLESLTHSKLNWAKCVLVGPSFTPSQCVCMCVLVYVHAFVCAQKCAWRVGVCVCVCVCVCSRLPV